MEALVKVVLILLAIAILVAGIALLRETFGGVAEVASEVSGAMDHTPPEFAADVREELSGSGFAALAMQAVLGERWAAVVTLLSGGVVTVILFFVAFALYKKVVRT